MAKEYYRPRWVEPDEMLEIGYHLLSDKDGYLKYGNIAGLKVPGYGIMPPNKRIIYFNTEYAYICKEKNLVFVGIREDADTRNCYHGVVANQEFLIHLLQNVR